MARVTSAISRAIEKLNLGHMIPDDETLASVDITDGEDHYDDEGYVG